MIKALTYGQFIKITDGHITFLKKSRNLCDELVVALSFDCNRSFECRTKD